MTISPSAPRRRWIWILLILLLVGIIGMSAFVYTFRIPIAMHASKFLREMIAEEQTLPEGTVIRTALYNLNIDRIDAPTDPGQGGALALFDDRLFLITRLGDFRRLTEDGNSFEPVALTLPGTVITKGVFYDREKDFVALGYKELLLRDSADGVEALVSQARVDPARNCVALVIHRAVVDRGALLSGDAVPADWQEIWESQPCLEDAVNTFPYQSGGDMAFLPDGTLGIFVGDFGIDGYNRSIPGIGPQLDGNDYGRVIALDPDTWAARHLTRGQRNPGGLVVDLDGNIWSSDHSAQGGDEINRIVEGANFGWPLENYGTHYGSFTWPPDDTTGNHDRFDAPVYAFVPSVAPSSIAISLGEEFPNWDGDLLLATLKAQTLYRLKMREGRVVVAEPIPLEARMRDIQVDSRGRIFIKDDIRGSVMILTNAATDAPDIPEALAAACSGCHQLAPGLPANAAGPTLVGVIGRDIASVQDYSYSDALTALDGTWTAERLIEYSLDPQGYAPGTLMPTADISRADLEAAIAAFQSGL